MRDGQGLLVPCLASELLSKVESSTVVGLRVASFTLTPTSNSLDEKSCFFFLPLVLLVRLQSLASPLGLGNKLSKVASLKAVFLTTNSFSRLIFANEG